MSREKVLYRSSFKTLLSTLSLAAAAIALIALAGCGSSRGNARPAAATTTAGSSISDAQGLTVDNLVEYGYSIPHRYRSQGSGQLTVGARNVEWRSERSKRDFSIQGDVIKTATLQCASQPGQNVCLELRIGTVTDLDYAFRDTNWAAGHNEKITEVYNTLKSNFPQVTFSEKSVKEID
ncbi:MAG TPA: hypothetical protein VIE43_00050 [Thermoanaerobaculia bacterium]|jgi:hypothetical protein|nr:hypothetical protein [Thermoanaerobaculia bacterium]